MTSGSIDVDRTLIEKGRERWRSSAERLRRESRKLCCNCTVFFLKERFLFGQRDFCTGVDTVAAAIEPNRPWLSAIDCNAIPQAAEVAHLSRASLVIIITPLSTKLPVSSMSSPPQPPHLVSTVLHVFIRQLCARNGFDAREDCCSTNTCHTSVRATTILSVFLPSCFW